MVLMKKMKKIVSGSDKKSVQIGKNLLYRGPRGNFCCNRLENCLPTCESLKEYRYIFSSFYFLTVTVYPIVWWVGELGVGGGGGIWLYLLHWFLRIDLLIKVNAEFVL